MPEPTRVLARKYRPQTFADLVGQEAMVRVLRNAFAQGRIAQAFVLTGIRGTGKTTTARIIAKGLNCVGPDGQGGPTTEPCGVCGPCVAIAEGRHVDVLEMDAASNTGVDDVREIIEGARYRAVEARYKVYVIDEVHMLSRNAFNALLKTLEEPPAHVKFVFATTEIRKVPVTVLSRCQRFDLRRIGPEAMAGLLRRIAGAEGAEVEEGAMALIVRAAEGSARDATSLLDQAIAGGGRATAAGVREMLGLADRGRVLDLFELVLRGDARGALGALQGLHADGADPLQVLRDLAEVAHWLSVLKVAPEAADDPALSPDERARGAGLALVPVRVLARAWQMLLKAIEEAGAAPDARMAAEMAVIRLTHVADLPSPEELVRELSGGAPAPRGAGAAPSPPSSGPVAARTEAGSWGTERAAARGGGAAAAAPVAAPLPSGPAAEAAPGPLDRYLRFEDAVEAIRAARDVHLLVEVEAGVRLVRYAPGRIEFAPAPGAPADLAQRLGSRLGAITAARWAVSVVAEGGAPSIREARGAREGAAEAEALGHPLVKAALAAFPEARFKGVRAPVGAPPPGLLAGAGPTEAPLAAPDDEFEPFEE